MAERTCHNCVYSCCDPGLWLRRMSVGEPILARCANHPAWPGRLHDVPGVPCRNYRPKPATPDGDVRMIALGVGSYAYVDAADYEWLSRWNWQSHVGYAARKEKGRIVYMHRQIMQPPTGRIVDHIDGNKTNNCRSNLRICTHRENSHNRRKQSGSRSRFKCVSYRKGERKWIARCWHKGKNRVLGFFDDEVEAARAYDRTAVECFKEFARLNFPEEWPPERRAEVYARSQEADDEGETTSSRAETPRRGDPKRTAKPVQATPPEPRATGKPALAKAGERRATKKGRKPPAKRKTSTTRRTAKEAAKRPKRKTKKPQQTRRPPKSPE